jgi:hypothetical protein
MTAQPIAEKRDVYLEIQITMMAGMEVEISNYS